MILLENSSGKGNDVGSNFNELGQIIDTTTNNKIGICFDTCHAFSKGYELRTKEGIQKTLDEFNKTIGLEKMKLVHLNDSKWDLGAKNDNHDHVGLGHIGEEGFKNILRSHLSTLPMVMETPQDERRTDQENMDYVRSLADSLGVS
jgi:deoxyribonuclease-4